MECLGMHNNLVCACQLDAVVLVAAAVLATVTLLVFSVLMPGVSPKSPRLFLKTNS